MTKTLTINLPENLEEQLGNLTNATDDSLEKLILQTLQTLANSIQSLHDANTDVRVKAATTLGLMGAETAIPALTQALEDNDITVRQAAAKALRQIGTESALKVLEQKLSTESSSSAQDSNFDPITPLIGTLHLETTDLAENHDRYLSEALELELNSGE